MVKYREHTIFAVCTLGEWFGMVYDQDDNLVYETLGYSNRDFTVEVAKLATDCLCNYQTLQ